MKIDKRREKIKPNLEVNKEEKGKRVCGLIKDMISKTKQKKKVVFSICSTRVFKVYSPSQGLSCAIPRPSLKVSKLVQQQYRVIRPKLCIDHHPRLSSVTAQLFQTL